MQNNSIRPNSFNHQAIQQQLDLPETPHTANVAHYLYLTKDVMPILAKTTKLHWPVSNDHCFQRIVLDNICGEIWYKKIKRPAYQHLSEMQAILAVKLCEQIIDGQVDLNMLNQQSLIWRSKKGTVLQNNQLK